MISSIDLLQFSAIRAMISPPLQPANTGTSDVLTDTTFEQTGLCTYLCRVLKHCKFVQPTPIQYHSIKFSLLFPESNYVCRSKSGTGKTIAFLSILLHSLITSQAEIQNKTYGVILLPTRELACQVQQTLAQLQQAVVGVKAGEEERRHRENFKKIRCILTIGGISFEDDRKKYRQQPHQIVISTVGRFWEMLSQHVIVLSKSLTLILDEGDKLFMNKDNKFKQALSLMDRVKTKWLIYSATYTPKVLQEIIKMFRFTYIHTLWKGTRLDLLVTDQIEAICSSTAEQEQPGTAGEFGNANLHMENIKKYQMAISVCNETLFQAKIKALRNLLTCLQYQKCLIFVEKKSFLQQIAESLTDLDPLLIHGSLSQAARFRMMNLINKSKIVIASDLLARGIDIRLDLVILFDAKQTDNFWHRIGRTGRYGRAGVAISLDTIEDPEWKQYSQVEVGQVLSQIDRFEEKNWFGSQMTEIGQWADVDAKEELRSGYKYFEQPIRLEQIEVDQMEEEHNCDPSGQALVLPQFASEQSLRGYVRSIMECPSCAKLVRETAELTGYQFEILKYLDSV